MSYFDKSTVLIHRNYLDSYLLAKRKHTPFSSISDSDLRIFQTLLFPTRIDEEKLHFLLTLYGVFTRHLSYTSTSLTPPTWTLALVDIKTCVVILFDIPHFSSELYPSLKRLYIYRAIRRGRKDTKPQQRIWIADGKRYFQTKRGVKDNTPPHAPNLYPINDNACKVITPKFDFVLTNKLPFILTGFPNYRQILKESEKRITDLTIDGLQSSELFGDEGKYLENLLVSSEKLEEVRFSKIPSASRFDYKKLISDRVNSLEFKD